MITSKQANEIYNEISPSLNRMGDNEPKEAERQTLYGDVLDWLRDMHPELRNKDYDDDFAAMFIVGRYVITHRN